MTHASAVRGLSTLAEDESLALAATLSVGRLVHVRDERLFVTPVNFLLSGRDVFVRTSTASELWAAAGQRRTAALEVDDLVSWSRSGWSVLVRGQLSRNTDRPTLERVAGAGLQPWAAGDREALVLLEGNEVTGRRIDPGPGGSTIVQVEGGP